MVMRHLQAWAGRAKRHVAANDRYRYYPLYSVLLAALLYVIVYWPFDRGVIQAWLAHRWIIIIDRWAWNAVLTLSIAFGIVGLLRPRWPARVISAVGIYMACQWLIAPFWTPIQWVSSRFMDVAFDRPARMIEQIAGAGTSAAAMLWCAYLLLLWIVLRPLARRGFRWVQSAESRIVARWPAMAKLQRPIL